MTHLLSIASGLALGWLLGVWGCTAALRRHAADLDLERLQLDLDRRNLRASQRAHFDAVVRAVVNAPQRPVPGRDVLKAGWLS